MESFPQQLDKHVARWRQLALNPASVPTNIQMGEDTVKQIYRRYSGKAPSAVVWCESPYQFAVLPAVIVNVLDGPGREAWRSLLVRVNAHGQAGSAEWEAAWKAQWRQFEEQTLRAIIQYISSSPTLRQPNDSARARLAKDVATTLHKLALANPSASWQFFDEKSRKQLKDGYGTLPSDFTCIKGGLRLQHRISEWLHVSPWTWVTSSGLGVGLGVWNPRMLNKILPAAEKLLGPEVRAVLSEDAMHKVGEAHDKCRELENFYGRLLAVWRGMAYEPRREPPLDVPTDGNVMRTMGSVIGQIAVRQWESSRREPQRQHVGAGFPLWLPYQFGWIPFALSCRLIDVDPLVDMSTEIDDWGYLTRAAMACNFTKHVAFLLKKPVNMTIQNERAHNESGPAITWGDGAETFAWKGITVDRSLIMEPEKITHHDITNEMNTEIRRVLIDRYGDAQYLQDSGAKMFHADEYGTLYRTQLPGDEALVMVKVQNSTPEPDGSYKYYYLRVPPNMTRAREAVAWTFGVEEKDYRPRIQS